jgi:hypothetical protein
MYIGGRVRVPAAGLIGRRAQLSGLLSAAV